jgi:hypothetical protein
MTRPTYDRADSWKGEPTVLQTSDGTAVTCADIRISGYLGTHWT